MSNFSCEKCGATCSDTKQGYITGCEHYPPDIQKYSVINDKKCHCGEPARHKIIPFRCIDYQYYCTKHLTWF